VDHSNTACSAVSCTHFVKCGVVHEEVPQCGHPPFCHLCNAAEEDRWTAIGAKNAKRSKKNIIYVLDGTQKKALWKVQYIV
jgi:hypothetical protein